MSDIYDMRSGSMPIHKINGYTVEKLELALRLRGEIANGYSISHNRLIFHWIANGDGIIPFPVPMDSNEMATIAFKWLKEQKYPPQPDHDGSNKKGWLVYCDNWGMVDGSGSEYSFIAIEPHWIMYGK